MAMSLYPKEGMPLWDKYSTHAIAHTIQVYSKYSFAYPYPVAWSVNGPVGGMEYPMICFNGPRPEKDGTYPERTKYALIGVVIHEVGHNFFPMIVNSDERQWTWMDEGLNSFVEYLAEEEWENDWNHRRDGRGCSDRPRREVGALAEVRGGAEILDRDLGRLALTFSRRPMRHDIEFDMHIVTSQNGRHVDAAVAAAKAAFEDWRVHDGARLLWYAWPVEWRALPLTTLRLRNAAGTLTVADLKDVAGYFVAGR